MGSTVQPGIEPAKGMVQPTPRRRWLTMIAIGAIVLALYAGALGWVNERLQTDIQKSIHAVPADNQDHSARE